MTITAESWCNRTMFPRSKHNHRTRRRRPQESNSLTVNQEKVAQLKGILFPCRHPCPCQSQDSQIGSECAHENAQEWGERPRSNGKEKQRSLGLLSLLFFLKVLHRRVKGRRNGHQWFDNGYDLEAATEIPMHSVTSLLPIELERSHFLILSNL